MGVALEEMEERIRSGDEPKWTDIGLKRRKKDYFYMMPLVIYIAVSFGIDMISIEIGFRGHPKDSIFRFF